MIRCPPVETGADRRLLLVHAHPDDEALSTGGTIAKYAAEGASVCLVTCTNGELGEVAEVPELGSVEEITARLGEVRRAELLEACRHLGPVDVRMLGYHDSGMDGTESNAAPHVFINQDLARVTADIAAIIREVRPSVVVTYNAYGFYGHPDHIRAHQATLAAVAESAASAGDHPPHRVGRVFFTAVPKSQLRMARQLWAEQAEQQTEGSPAEEVFTEEEVERIGTDDERISTAVDVTQHLRAKFAALEAHRTQRGTTEWVLSMPEHLRTLAFGVEYFEPAEAFERSSDGYETDLFAGL